MDIAGSSAIVTGGAGGLGQATVVRLLEAGAQVVIADLTADRGTSLAERLGTSAHFVPTDVTDEGSVQEALAVASGFAPLRSAVVVHGGSAAARRIVDRQGKTYPLDTFRRTIEIFLTGTFNVLSQAAGAMSQNEPLESNQRGVVITTASIAGFEGQVGQVDYSAAKGGIIGMNLTAARDLAPAGVRVMCIAPGTFFTPAYRMSEEEAGARWGPSVPNPKRMGRASEYAELALEIIHNDFLNGEVIRIDGGLRFNI